MRGLGGGDGCAKRRGARRHGPLHGARRGGHGGVCVRPAQRRFKFFEGVAQSQKRQRAGGAPDLVGSGGEFDVRVGLRGNGLQQGCNPRRQLAGEFEGPRRADRGLDLLQAISAQLRGHCDVLSGGDDPRSL